MGLDVSSNFILRLLDKNHLPLGRRACRRLTGEWKLLGNGILENDADFQGMTLGGEEEWP